MSCKIVVRMKDVLEKSKPYIRNRKLGAYKHQYMTCTYDYGDGCRCIIGCALSPKQIKKLKDNDLLDECVEEIVTNVSEEEVEDMQTLQTFHDTWGHIPTQNNKDQFFKVLRQMRKKYLKKTNKAKSV